MTECAAELDSSLHIAGLKNWTGIHLGTAGLGAVGLMLPMSTDLKNHLDHRRVEPPVLVVNEINPTTILES